MNHAALTGLRKSGATACAESTTSMAAAFREPLDRMIERVSTEPVAAFTRRIDGLPPATGR
jgi:hypothetical protein